MFNRVKRISSTLAFLVVISSAVLADSVDVKVIGTITPTACKLSISPSGIVDYGVINTKNLRRDEFTQLDNKQLSFSIICNSPTKVAMRAVNNRPNSVAGSNENDVYGATAPKGISRINGVFVVGLGFDKKRIGGYSIRLSDVTADGEFSDYIYQPQSGNGNGVWLKEFSSYFYFSRPTIISWSKKGTPAYPMSLNTLSGILNVQAYINKKSDLDLSEPVKLDGLTALELIYL